MPTLLSDIGRVMAEVVLPTTCVVCGEVLVGTERQLCMGCVSRLAESLTSDYADNPVERRLLGRVDVEAGMALYNYRREGTARRVVHAMKFHGNAELCRLMGRQLGLELLRSGRFDDVDLLLPVPLHWLRRLRRGYNQSELLCRGVAEVFGRPVETKALVRHRYTRQQSLQRSGARESNVRRAFRVRRPDRLAGRHVLLVDDVLTTGATLAACFEALRRVDGLRVSVATLAMAGN